ncbi:MAG: hypothetical protein Q4B47_02155 [Eubacteriales bacterium]|nr:hypothetical protein [Eubacteriales bacterium]
MKKRKRNTIKPRIKRAMFFAVSLLLSVSDKFQYMTAKEIAGEDTEYNYQIKIKPLTADEGKDRLQWLEVTVYNQGESTLEKLTLTYEFSAENVRGRWLVYRTETINENQLTISRIEPLKSHSVFLLAAISDVRDTEAEENTEIQENEEEKLTCIIHGCISCDDGKNTVVNDVVQILKREGNL